MKIKDLQRCPGWLLSAETSNADVEIIAGVVIWRGGDWRGGDWRGGDWRGGDWYDGDWHNGIWRGGDWRGGDWRGGDWYDGDWHNGIWHGGRWRGGTWHGGTWHSGMSTLRSKYIPSMSCDGSRIIKVGCEVMDIESWERWLASPREFDTPRNDPSFKLIRAHILAAITYKKALLGEL